MGSANASSSKSGGQSQAFGGSEQGSTSYGTSGGYSQGTGYGQSTTAQDVWGAQQPALQALYGQAGQLATGQGAPAQAAQQTAQQAQNAWLGALTPGGNPYFSQSVQAAIDQATQGFNQSVLPDLDARGVAVGQYGSARDNLARGEAAGQFGQGLAQQVAGMYSNQYAADQALRGQALAMAPQIQGMQTAPLTTAAGLIGGPTVLGQSQSTNATQNTANNWAQNMANSFGNSWNQAMSNQFGKSSSVGMGVGAK